MSDPIRRAARGTVMLTAAQLCLTASSYVVAVALARELGPPLYGIYGIIYSFLLSTELIARLGIPQAVSKLIAEHGGRTARLEATGVTLTLAVYLLVFVAFWLSAPVLAVLFRVPDGAELFRIACLDVPFYGAYFMVIHVLNGRRNFGSESLTTIVYGLAKVIGIVILIHYGPTVSGALIVNVAASIVGLAFGVQRAGPRVFALTLECKGPILRLAIPVALMALGTQLMQSMDLWMLNALGPDQRDVNGLYVAALNLARVPNLAAFVMTAVLIPSVANALATGQPDLAARTVRGGVRFLVAVLLPGCGLVAAEANGLMALVFSDQYAGAGRFLAVLIFAHGLSFTMFVSLCAVLIAVGHQRRSAEVALGVVPLAVLLNVALVPGFGAPGAAAAALLSMLVAVVVSGYLVRRAIGLPVEPWVLGRTALATLVVSGAALLVESSGLLLLVELGVLSLGYLGLLALLGVITRADLAPFLGSAAPPG